MATLEVHDSRAASNSSSFARSSGVVRNELGMRRGPSGRVHPAGARADSLEVQEIQGRGLARRGIRADQRPQDDHRQHPPGRRDHRGRLPDVPDPGRGRSGASPGVEVAGEDDRTRVAPPPVVPCACTSSRRGRRPAERDEPPVLEQDDWLDAVRTPQGREPGIAPAEAPLKRGFARGRKGEPEYEETLAKAQAEARRRRNALRGSQPCGARWRPAARGS